MMKQDPWVVSVIRCIRVVTAGSHQLSPPDKYCTNRIARAISSWETANCCTCGPWNGSALFVRGPVPNILRKSILGLHLGAARPLRPWNQYLSWSKSNKSVECDQNYGSIWKTGGSCHVQCLSCRIDHRYRPHLSWVMKCSNGVTCTKAINFTNCDALLLMCLLSCLHFWHFNYAQYPSPEGYKAWQDGNGEGTGTKC